MNVTLPRAQLFAADYSALTDVRGFVSECAGDASLPVSVTDDLLVAVTEACRDMLTHERSSLMYVSWWAHDGAVEIRVRDDGVTDEPPPVVEIHEGEESFGFPFILAFVDEVDVRLGTPDAPGTTVRIVRGTDPA